MLGRIHEFLKQENEVGNITRQEAVSMVPPLFLDVQSHHYVLDMCKSAMLAFLPKGMVIENDVDVERCSLLIHQTKRMCSANLLVTDHEAQNFPSYRCKNNGMLMQAMNETEDNGSGRLETNKDPNTESMTELLFDRILCDVPCSGNGTIRKAPDIWKKKWNDGLGNGVHRLQVQIAMQGVALLKVQGKLFSNPQVYICFSKSEFGPVEHGRNSVNGTLPFSHKVAINFGIGSKVVKNLKQERNHGITHGILGMPSPSFNSNPERMHSSSNINLLGRANFGGAYDDIRVIRAGNYVYY